MTRESVYSSDVAAIGYDPSLQVLEVEFNDASVYQYSGVPAYVHAEFMQAPSKGKYLHANIARRYSYQRIN